MIHSYNESQRDALFLRFIDKVFYMFWTVPLSFIRSISKLYTQQQVFVMLVLLASAPNVELLSL